MPGFAWAGAGGRPVGAGGAAVGSSGEYRADSNMHAPRESLSHRCAGVDSSSQRPMSSQAYRQGPAIGDSGDVGMSPFGGRIDGAGAKRVSATAAAGGAGATPSSADTEQALAVWGLSALCQVASATEAPGSEEGIVAGRRLGGGQLAADAPVAPRSPRTFNDKDRLQKRQCRSTNSVTIASRLSWGGRGDDVNEELSSNDDREVRLFSVALSVYDFPLMSFPPPPETINSYSSSLCARWMKLVNLHYMFYLFSCSLRVRALGVFLFIGCAVIFRRHCRHLCSSFFLFCRPRRTVSQALSATTRVRLSATAAALATVVAVAVLAAG